MPQQPELENQQPEIANQTQDSGSENSDQDNFWTREISRRTLLKGGVLIGTSVGLAVAARGTANLISSSDQKTQQPEQPNQTPIPESTKSPEIENSGIGFGGNTHLHPFAEGEAPFEEGEDNMTLEEAMGDVDRLVEAGMEWIRFNLINPGTITQKEDGSLEFSKGIGAYDQLIDYAKQKGLKIALVTNAPESLASAPIDEYVEKSAAFYTQLALRYGEKIDTWQIFNEANTHDFRNYKTFGQDYPEPPNYLEDLAKVISASAEAIKAILPNTKTTMNAAMVYGANNYQMILDETIRFFDALSPYLDFTSIDPYPDLNDPNISWTIPNTIEHLVKRYDNKDIFVAEIGVPSRVIPDPQRRAKILLDQISAIKGGNVKPKGVFIYEMRDEKVIGNKNNEGTFGTQDIFEQLSPHMQSEESEADQ